MRPTCLWEEVSQPLSDELALGWYRTGIRMHSEQGAWQSWVLSQIPALPLAVWVALCILLTQYKPVILLLKLEQLWWLSQRFVVGIQLDNMHTGPVQGLVAHSKCSVNTTPYWGWPPCLPVSLPHPLPPVQACVTVASRMHHSMSSPMLPFFLCPCQWTILNSLPKPSTPSRFSLLLISSFKLPNPCRWASSLPFLMLPIITVGLYFLYHIRWVPHQITSIWWPIRHPYQAVHLVRVWGHAFINSYPPKMSRMGHCTWEVSALH